MPQTKTKRVAKGLNTRDVDTSSKGYKKIADEVYKQHQATRPPMKPPMNKKDY